MVAAVQVGVRHPLGVNHGIRPEHVLIVLGHDLGSFEVTQRSPMPNHVLSELILTDE